MNDVPSYKRRNPGVQLPNGAPPKVVATVNIVMLEDGNVQAQAQVPNRQVFLMMMEVSKFDIERNLVEQAKANAMLPPAGLELPNIRG